MNAHEMLFVRTDLAEETAADQGAVVMVTGPFGSGMEEMAYQLANHLGRPYYDPHQLETLARDRERHDTAWRHLKESVGSFFAYWLGHLRERAGMSQREHQAHIHATIREIANQGGVIAGFCTHMALPGEKLFRIQVTASPDYCAHRLAITRAIGRSEATELCVRLEEERRQFLHDLFEEEFIDQIPYDLVLDAEHTSIKEMLAICLEALGQKGMLAKAA